MNTDPLLTVLQRAATDPEYRRELKANPALALSQAGVEVEADAGYEQASPGLEAKTNLRAGQAPGPYPPDSSGRPTGMPICFG